MNRARQGTRLLGAALLLGVAATCGATEDASESAGDSASPPVTVPDMGLELIEIAPSEALPLGRAGAAEDDDGTFEDDTGDAGDNADPGATGIDDERFGDDAPATDVATEAGNPDDDTDQDDEIPGTWGTLELLGARVLPGTRADLHWSAGQSFAGSAIETPVVVIRGTNPGPTLCLTAAVHGDELNGVEIVRRVLAGVSADELSGTLIGVPIVNLLGFTRGSRYLPDRRDLNRYFPGHPRGSSASRIAHAFFSEVVVHCERLVDFHTGSFKRTNLPQLRANLDEPEVREFVQRFGATSVLHKAGDRATLRAAATNAGIPAVTFELGEPGTLQERHVKFGIKAIDTLLDKLGMVKRFRLWAEPQPIFYRSRWLRAYRGGILSSGVRVGAHVREGELLGVVTNPLTNEQSEIRSPYDGRLLGRALNQFVLPGFATFHIGIGSSDVPDTATAALGEEAAPDYAADDDEERPEDAAGLDEDEEGGAAEASEVIDEIIEDMVEDAPH
ncbi:MAG: succinylglutamate desuccinylase/aspartoacylase family protein [Gammaproteobacteria bacterium]